MFAFEKLKRLRQRRITTRGTARLASSRMLNDTLMKRNTTMRITGMLLLAAVGGLPETRAALNVVATLPDYGALAMEVGGNKLKVTNLAKGTEDPHFVDARPSFIRALNQADLLLEGGAELEIGWLPPLLTSARNPKILTDTGHLPLSRGLTLRDVPTGPIDRSMGDVHPAGNPHYNLDPMNGKLMAAAIAEALSRLDPADQSVFQTNLQRFTTRLDAKLVEWTRVLQPFRGTKVLTYHRSFDYFLERFGFVLVGTIEPRPGLEPSPAHINALIPKAKEAGVKLVLIEPNRPRRTPTQVAEAIGARLVLLPILVGGADKANDYVALFDYNVARLVEALQPPK
jgi:ABC-type Zn uptake system ZnuABC Zn-binding protein ZnuA